MTARIHKPSFFLAALLGLLGIVGISGSFLLDDPVSRWIQDANEGHWSHNPAAEFLSKFGDWPELMLAGLVGYLLARRFRNVRWQRILISAMIASTLAGMTVNISRLTTGRTRPRAVAEQGWYGPKHGDQWLIGEADFNSFPSGHTATAFGFAGVLLFACADFGLIAVALASAIALSRILLGAHHPSDVVAAALISLLVAWVVWFQLGQRGRIDGLVRGSVP